MTIGEQVWYVCSRGLGARASDTNLLAGCLQAQATLRAGLEQAHSARQAGFYTLVAGLAAILAAGVGAWAVRSSSWDDIRLEREKLLRAGLGLCVVYLSEVNALQDYLKQHDVVGTLRKFAEREERMHFHPGSKWLLKYQSDPGSVGLFPNDLASKLTYYHSRMLNEIGRLIWMHNLAASTVDDSLKVEMLNSAETLKELTNESLAIKLALKFQVEMTELAIRDSICRDKTYTSLLKNLIKSGRLK